MIFLVLLAFLGLFILPLVEKCYLGRGLRLYHKRTKQLQTLQPAEEHF